MKTGHSAERLEVMDGLRGLAILLVLWFHFWQLSWQSARFELFSQSFNLDFIGTSGYLGVELFFFISGFCLYLPYARAKHQGAREQRWGEYAYRRAIKILPSYFLAIAIILAFFERGLGSISNWFWHLGTHLFFVHTWFPETYSSINGIFWSLAVEVQFYVIFPLICWCFRRNIPLTYVAGCALAIAFRAHSEAKHLARFDYFINQLPAVIDLFLTGMLASDIVTRFRAHPRLAQKGARTLMTAGALLSLCALLYMFTLANVARFGNIRLWQSQNRLTIGLIFFALAVCSCFAAPIWKRILANRVLLFLSTISYNLYIWHQYIARYLMEHHWPPSLTADPHDDPQWKLAYLAVSMVAAVGFSAALTYFFERPILKGKWELPFRKAARATV